MLPTVKKTPKKTDCSIIKIKSPKSDIKLHRVNSNEKPKTSSELAVLASNNQTPNDDMDKFMQAWNRLKITALSKAIAIAPDVKSCTIGPNTSSISELNFEKYDDTDKPDLSNAVTSTPLKSKISDLKNKKTNTAVTSLKNNDSDLDISEISPSKAKSNFSISDEIHLLNSLQMQCLNKIEAKIAMAVMKKSKECSRAWLENDERIREKLATSRVELEKERLLRIQEQNIESQKLLVEYKISAQLQAQQLEQSEFDSEKRIAETDEKIRKIEQKRKELSEREKRRREELKQYIYGIYELQISYGRKYNDITEMTTKCKDVQALNEKVTGEVIKLKGMNEHLIKLVEKCNEGKVTLKDLKSAETLVQHINVISEIFSKKTGEINKSFEKVQEERNENQLEKEEKLKKEDDEQKVKQFGKAKKKQNNKAQVEHSVKLVAGVEDCISEECLKRHLELTKFLEDYEKSLQPLLNNGALKNFRFDCQKLVNVPVNAISPLDDLHLEDKFYKLSRMLRGQAVPLGNTLFLPTGHPLGVSYCTNLLAKKFVKQGEHTVSSKPEAAFAIAAVIAALWADFPDFGRLLLAHFHRRCPYLIPAFLPQIEGQTNEDYYKMLGYQYAEDGKVESHDKFLRRMSGMMRLYSAILVTPLKCSQLTEGKKHPHSMKEAWRWFSATLNLCPRSDISPTLIFDFLEVTGRMFYMAYGIQFIKLIHVLCTDYFPLIEQVTPDGCGGPVVRLKSFLEKILKEGQVPPPPGLLPPNFW